MSNRRWIEYLNISNHVILHCQTLSDMSRFMSICKYTYTTYNGIPIDLIFTRKLFQEYPFGVARFLTLYPEKCFSLSSTDVTLLLIYCTKLNNPSLFQKILDYINRDNINVIKHIIRFFGYSSQINYKTIYQSYRGKACNYDSDIECCQRRSYSLKIDNVGHAILLIFYKNKIQYSNGMSLLHFATYFGNVGFAIHLLNDGWNPNIRDKDGNNSTPLSYACIRGQIEIVSLLLEFGADITAIDDNGDTALHDACYYGHFEIVKLLLKHHAKRRVQNKQRIRPIDYARDQKHRNIVHLLKIYGK